MKFVPIIAAATGLALGTYLVLSYGFSDVCGALLAAGWWGLAAVSIAHLAAIGLCGLAWRVLLIQTSPPYLFLTFFWARILRDGVNNLIGIVPCAGEIAGGRELALRGVPAPIATASTVIDVTTELLSQLLFTLLGLAILITEQPATPVAWWSAAGLALATAAIVGFALAQNNGLFRFLESLPDRLGLLQSWKDGAGHIHVAIKQIYSQRDRISAAIVVHFVAWLVRCVEAVIALRLMGSSLTLAEIVALEALIYALRSVAFAVPSAIGVQEAGYVFVGGLFGLSPDLALALSLIKRAREVALGFPALIAWQLLETRRLRAQIARRECADRNSNLVS
jgi:putative membrane protein